MCQGPTSDAVVKYAVPISRDFDHPSGREFGGGRPELQRRRLEFQPLEKEQFPSSNPWIFQGLEKLPAGKAARADRSEFVQRRLRLRVYGRDVH